MTATPLTLAEGTEMRPVLAPVDALPSRRRQREHERSGSGEDRIPALAALDAAAEFLLVVRDADGYRIFSEGGMVAQDPDGREVSAGTGGRELDGALPILVARHEDGEDIAVEAAVPVSAVETTEDADDLFESLLELGEATIESISRDEAIAEAISTDEAVVEPSSIDEAAVESMDTDELGETNRVPGLVRGSGSAVDDEPEAPEEQSSEAAVALALVLEDGRRIPADHTVLLGRSPSARPDDESAEQVALDPTLTDISRNHVEIRVEDGSVLARDLASTNGTVLTREGQSPRLLPTDEPIRLLPGDSLNLGGSAVVEVEAIV